MDALVIHKLRVFILGEEAVEGIANGRLGCYHPLLHLSRAYCFDKDYARVGPDMIEAMQSSYTRQSQVSNWREMLTGIRLAEFRRRLSEHFTASGAWFHCHFLVIRGIGQGYRNLLL